MQFVILWTDALIYLLVVVATLLIVQVSRNPHLRAQWRQVLRRPLAMGAMVVLLVYIIVGLTDSVHLRLALEEPRGGHHAGTETVYGGEVLSLFDLALGPIRSQVEKTYSAPFATRLFVKETRVLADGRQVRDYPRLQYGGAHLADPDRGRARDILRTALLAGGQALALWGALLALVVALAVRRRGLAWQTALRRTLLGGEGLPWHTAVWTLAVVLVLVFGAAHLGVKYHLLGTDKVGQDVFYGAIKSIRTGLVIGTLTTLVMLPFAIWLGLAAGWFRGWVDDVVQYLYTTLSSIPGVLLIASAVLLLQVFMANHPQLFDNVAARADLRLLFLCIILGVTSWTGLCRLLRGETLKLREVEFVQAAVAFGVGPGRILRRHILPNVMHIVLISIVLDFSALVLAEAVLSYIEVGVDPTTPSWGNMINAARLEMAREPVVWWQIGAAFVFMFTLVLSANLFADAVRDAFDPHLRHG